MRRRSPEDLDPLISGGLLGLLAGVAVLNALTYPPLGGYDAQQHVAYAYEVSNGRLPEGGASYTPPGYYALAAGAIRLGEMLGLEEPERLGQLLNALCLVASGVLVLVLARLLFPGRVLVAWSALAFFACSPVVLKTGAMFHPQPLAMLLSLLALTTTAWMIVRRDYRLSLWAALAVALAGAQLVRSVSLWVVGVVLIALVTAAIAQPEHRRRIGTTLVGFLLAIILLPLPWYLYLQSTAGNPVFGREFAFTFDSPWPDEFYLDPGLPDVITHPQRADLGVGILPILYAETWGDFFGIWSWGRSRPELSPAVNRRLMIQSVVGLPLTALALAGWFALVGTALTRSRQYPARVIVVLAPALGFAAVVYYASRALIPDGDTIKALFLLPAVPFWALAFGFAVDVLTERHLRVGLGVLALVALCLLVSLSYGTFAVVT